MARILRAKRAKASVKRARGVSKFPKAATGELVTLLDFVRYAVSRFTEAKLTFAHGTPDPVAEAAFLVCEMLHLHPDQFEMFATARLTAREAKSILEVIARRVASRKPAAYLVNKIYMRGLPFYVDERVIVPRSYIGELLDSHFSGEGDEGLRADRRSRTRWKTCSTSAPAPAVSPFWRAGTFRTPGSTRSTSPGMRSMSPPATWPISAFKTG